MLPFESLFIMMAQYFSATMRMPLLFPTHVLPRELPRSYVLAFCSGA